MTKEERIQYVEYRIKTARKTFNAAKLLLENGFPSSAVGRFYYSVFLCSKCTSCQKRNCH